MYVMNLVSLIFIAVVVFGIVSCYKAIKTGRTTSGDRIGISLFLVVVVGLVVVSTFCPYEHARRPKRESCLRNLKQLSVGIQMYADDYDGSYPVPERWNDDLYPYVKSERLFQCPQAHRNDVPTYAMNVKVKGRSTKDSTNADTTVVLFDSIPGKDLAGGSELLPQAPRHEGGYCITFVDGHAKWFSASDTLNQFHGK